MSSVPLPPDQQLRKTSRSKARTYPAAKKPLHRAVGEKRTAKILVESNYKRRTNRKKARDKRERVLRGREGEACQEREGCKGELEKCPAALAVAAPPYRYE